jgi:hypothetical protein
LLLVVSPASSFVFAFADVFGVDGSVILVVGFGGGGGGTCGFGAIDGFIIYDGDAIIVTDTDTFVSTIGFPRDRKLVGIDFDSCKTLLVDRVMLLEESCVLLVFALTISLLATTKSAYFDSKVLNRVSPKVDISFKFCSF